MSYKVFISSTSDDLELATDLARRLEAAGVKVPSVKKTSLGGNEILGTVNRSLREADEVLILLTSNSGDKHGLWSEIGMAYGLGKRVTPVVVNYDPEKLPALARRQHIKYADLTGFIAELATRAKLRKAD